MINKNRIKAWYEGLTGYRKQYINDISKISYHSCALEGNTLTFEQTKYLLIILEYCKENNIPKEIAFAFIKTNT